VKNQIGCFPAFPITTPPSPSQKKKNKSEREEAELSPEKGEFGKFLRKSPEEVDRFQREESI